MARPLRETVLAIPGRVKEMHTVRGSPLSWPGLRREQTLATEAAASAGLPRGKMLATAALMVVMLAHVAGTPRTTTCDHGLSSSILMPLKDLAYAGSLMHRLARSFQRAWLGFGPTPGEAVTARFPLRVHRTAYCSAEKPSRTSQMTAARRSSGGRTGQTKTRVRWCALVVWSGRAGGGPRRERGALATWALAVRAAEPRELVGGAEARA
jgi:hypothetical protein